LISALWLAGCSALTALLLYLLGAAEIAVLELSVGAGLVTVLFVFAINIAGEEMPLKENLLPRPLAWILVVGAVVLLGWMVLGPMSGQTLTGSEPGFANVLWNDRALDVALQVLLIFAGVLGVLGLLSDVKNNPKGGKNEH
jgi:NADH:ubiquinone oxidoreductase subunit 6 (subunit J)